eukprot:TRINITY_DN14982_c0_g2_i1.p1 TRINITY_DN14982_c0_g2~~TRINITY_DN14982_c0_g2_i1.p1  ORF type:complete len:272 (-),score=39.44 TRINITY_DN14982_c0_g2_i1:126-941(-)
MQIRHGLAAAVNCFAKRAPAAERLCQRALFCSGSASPKGDASKSWTIDVPTVDPYLKRQPGNVVGELSDILCEVGSHVYVNEEVAVIETDKVAVTVHAQREGIICAILANLGDEVRENQPIYAAHDASLKLGYTSRRWAREYSYRKARKEKEEQVERERVLRLWRDTQEKQKQEKQSHERQRQGHHQSYHYGSSRNNWQRYDKSTSGNHSYVPSIDDALATLGLKPGASKRAIKAAFRKKALQYHPDHNSDAAAADKFRAVRDAYDRLSRS